MNQLCFEKVANGVWKASIGSNYPTLLGLSGTTPAPMPGGEEPAFPFDPAGVTAGKVHERHVLSIPFSKSENLYGLGLSYQGLGKTYAVVHLRSDHYKTLDNGRTHVPTPFYVSTAGYGVFVDTTAFPTFYMGGHVRKDAKNPPQEQDRGSGKGWSSITPSEFVEVSFAGEGADIYILAGKSMTDVVSRFNLLCGGGCMVPKWGLGFWNRVLTRATTEDVHREVELYREHDFPLDVIGLEPGWQSNSYPCSFDWSTERFPEPGKLSSELLEQGIRLNLWENMYVSRRSSIYSDIYPLSGSHMVWNGVVPDYTLEEARKIYKEHHKKYQLDIGISGFKIDECDGYDKYLWPDHAEFPSGNSAATLRQSYGVLSQRMVQEMYRERNTRTYGLVRASNAGASSFPFCIYNDCYSFKEFLNGISTAAFSGTLWVPEVRDAKSPEEWVRRFQLCSVSSMLMLNAWASGAKPWKYPEVEPIIRDTILFRKRLMPYLYNVFYTYHKTGLPPFRPLCMDFGGIRAEEVAGSAALDHTANPYEHKEIRDITNQFMIGEYLMAAPVEPGLEEREVILPAGYKWYNFFTGEYVGSGEKKVFSCPLDQMLLFVREGGLIPTVEPDGKTLHVKCFGDKGETTFYDDDGVSFNYERGEYSLTTLSFVREGDKIVGKAETVYDKYPSAYEIVFE